MSKILAIDSSAEVCSVALSQGGQCAQELSVAPREHTRKILPMVEKLLADYQLGLKDLDAIAFGRGPGSFTGLRICAGLVQGLAFGCDIPVVPISSLQAVAVGADKLLREGSLLKEHQTLPRVVAFDARMDEVYWAVYTPTEDGCVLEGEERLSSPDTLASALEQYRGEFIALGSGWRCGGLKGVSSRLRREDCVPEAFYVAQLGKGEYQLGNALPAEKACPVYLRDTVSWQKRQRIRDKSSEVC